MATESIVPTCLFNDCTAPGPFAGKCDRHRGKVKCQITECFNQVYARHLCVRHGGKLQCQAPGCMANARAHGFCCKHGAKSIKKVCQEPGCDRKARLQNRCASHGGKQHLRAKLEMDWVDDMMNWIEFTIDTPSMAHDKPRFHQGEHDAPLAVPDIVDQVFLEFMIEL
ncbi:Aste57867_11832 [Aphanomyces stellatus]|uniref:Aste57867_11832 protein n=1 Tax=Aphanomyces stellatus TaxID=120398 RepID=A0A485KU19_9STRA|nr:hypothetical protein As57867_011787 [Aphanomyces stellatus]VFT88687.1 Aste57867_11832 [Aphanomyces stellatus]